MNEIGVDPFVAERTIGHTLPTRIMSVFKHAGFDSERQAAVDLLSQHIQELINGQ